MSQSHDLGGATEPAGESLDGSSELEGFTIPRASRVFVNRTLRMDQIDWVGFDMDYTLAIYKQDEIDRLSIDATVKKLVAPRVIACIIALPAVTLTCWPALATTDGSWLICTPSSTIASQVLLTQKSCNAPASAVATSNVMMQSAAFAQRHADQPALGGLGRLADRLGNLARLAGAVADATALVANDDDRGEGEAPAALHHLRDAIDGDQLVLQFVVLVAVATAAAVTIARIAAAGTPG